MAERNYRKEYDNYHAKPENIKKRAERNSARAKMAKAGLVRKGDGKDVDHKNGSTKDNSMKNLRAVPASVNRSYKRTKTARKVNPKD